MIRHDLKHLAVWLVAHLCVLAAAAIYGGLM
jgi:hypothetical protein